MLSGLVIPIPTTPIPTTTPTFPVNTYPTIRLPTTCCRENLCRQLVVGKSSKLVVRISCNCCSNILHQFSHIRSSHYARFFTHRKLSDLISSITSLTETFFPVKTLSLRAFQIHQIVVNTIA